MHMSMCTCANIHSFVIERIVGIYCKKSITEPVLDRIVSKCDVRGDGVLSGSELQHCGRLIQPGLILHTIFNKSNRLVPEIKGSCGELLATEFASSDSLHATIFARRPWPGRVQLALALLDYIQVLELVSLARPSPEERVW